MTDVFLKVLNISITASYIVVAVLLLRLALKKAPKWSVCLLWCIVALRLVIPFTLESEISLIPSAEPITVSESAKSSIEVNTGIDRLDSKINGIIASRADENTADTDTAAGSGNTAEKTEKKPFPWLKVLSAVWLTGAAAVLVYGGVSYILISENVKAREHYRDNIYFCDSIDTSFILGLIKPKIYIPSGTQKEYLDYIIQHERAHLKRCDHLLKPFAFLLISFHWFNPFIWIAYILLCRDIEGACDERVIEDENITDIMGYSAALLDCGVNRRMLIACPVAFGEVSVKARIKSVLKYKRPADWLSAVAIVLSLAVALCFLTNPKATINALDGDISQTVSDTSQDLDDTENTALTDETPPDNNDKNTTENTPKVEDNDSLQNQQTVSQNQSVTPPDSSVNPSGDTSVDTGSSTENEQRPSVETQVENNFIYPWPDAFYETLSTPEYTDRLPQSYKLYRESLGSVQKAMYDKYLPYVLTYTPFYIDLGTATDYQWLNNVMGAIKADYPETAFYFEFSYYDAPLYERDWQAPYEHYGWSEYFTIDCTESNIKNFNKQKVENYIGQLESACDKIIAQMPASLSTKEKYKWLADYICDKTQYEGDNASGAYLTADGPLLYGKGCGQAYSLAYQMLCHRAELFASTYYKTPEYTATDWNIIRLDDGATYYMNLSEADRTNKRSYYYFKTERTIE